MTSPWRIDEAQPDDLTAEPPGLLASLAFLRAALRRRWRTWVAAGLVGLLLGVAYVAFVPVPSKASVSVLLAQPPDQMAADEMLTAISFLRTRTVAERTLEKLDSDLTPPELEASFTEVATTSTVLQIVVSAPTDREAVRTAGVLAETFLAFRGERLMAQAEADVKGDTDRIKDLERTVADLTADFERNSTGTLAQQSAAEAALSDASRANDEINTLQQEVATRLDEADGVIKGSSVFDPATVVEPPGLKRAVLVAMTGLIGGLFVGVGVVLFGALTSERLRRREDVALAIGAPVRSAVRQRGPRRRFRLVPIRRRRVTDREGLAVLARGLESAFEQTRTTPSRVVLATVDNEPEGVTVSAEAAARLAGGQRQVFLVDLTSSGRLERSVRDALARQQGGPAQAPAVFRPRGVPQLARGPLAPVVGITSDLRDDHPLREAWDAADSVLTLAPVDLEAGVDDLASWGTHVVLLVTAGRSSAEELRSAADLVRKAGLELLFALMVGSDRTDASHGHPDEVEPAPERQVSS